MSAGGTVAENRTVVVIGGGVGGLSASIQAAALGFDVTVLEQAPRLGGKMRELEVGGRAIDSGPTVMTMRWAFDGLFAAAGRTLGDYVELVPVEILARHAWPDGSRLDLFADIDRSASAITEFADAREAEGYRRFCAHCERIYSVVEQPFLRSERPSVSSVVTAKGLRGALDFASIDWHRTMWSAIGSFFRDPRLRQLFGRYATYYGSSPFRSPATLNLIAHVEQAGVWRVKGGMYRLAEALVRVAEEQGVALRTGAEVRRVLVADGRAVGVELRGGERIHADAVIVNAAPQAVDEGRLGAELRGCVRYGRGAARSLSAVTWSTLARTRGFPLAHHSVFFSRDYPAEFRAVERGELIDEPTVYVCAQDRVEAAERGATPDWSAPERLLVLVNAPARGDEDPWTRVELDALERRSFAVLRDAGLELDVVEQVRTSPAQFERLFPATGGALYGFATHTMMAPFRRPQARAGLERLYLAGGGAHPGAGVPMVCLSGQIAGRAVAKDLGRS
ncbi:Hydroxyneurosporene desaturase [Enhygromyxa salina]|uniref:Hydroxyneurosporene desaturase n=1 Tax=Enhygromyxa salina TaxID=215803 RepID=A0A2S9YCB6_9BACT|nr:1-hydroxycarotenoid 3,4-desaturase CrtD [Enhygromyxa salina]PRQ02757.1 Hydroxyneurosporene desaturase [Enhygromyxa salina]